MKEYEVIERMKGELLSIHQKVQEQPDLLDDITTRCLYDSLMKVRSFKELNNWIKALEKTELSSVGQVACDNKGVDLFGRLHLLLMILPDYHFETAVALIRKLKETGFDPYYYREEITDCLKRIETIRHQHPEAIVLFSNDDDKNLYYAFDRDADVLFERYGWQTAEVKMDNKKKCSLMMVGQCGFEFLIAHELVLTEKCGFQLDIEVEDKSSAHLCDSQQTIDYFRSILSDDIIMSSHGLSYYPVEDGIETEKRYPFIYKENDEFGLYSEDCDVYPIVKGHTWSFLDVDMALVNNLSAIILIMQANKKNLDNEINDWNLLQDIFHQFSVFIEYIRYSEENPEKLVIMKSGDSYYTFGGDALTIANLLQRKVWECDDAVILFLKPADLELLEESFETICIESEYDMDFNKLRLNPSRWNVGLCSPVIFEDTRIIRTKNGGFAVKATIDGQEIPMVEVPEESAKKILGYKEGIFRQTAIKCYLAQQINDRYTLGCLL